MKKKKEKREPLEEEQEIIVHGDDGDMLELKPLLNIQKWTFYRHFQTQTISPQWSTQDVSFRPNMVDLRPHLNHGHLLNLRTNSFQQGKDNRDPPCGHP